MNETEKGQVYTNDQIENIPTNNEPEFKDRPIYQSYSLSECFGIFAGEYPGSLDEDHAKLKIDQLIQFGIRHFIDLTEEGELNPYNHLLPDYVTHTRFPIRDCHAPNSIDDVNNLLNMIKEIKKEDGYVYIHCWGGVGRTGTIVACLLAKFNKITNPNQALKILRKNFAKMPKASYRKSPENKEQVNFVKNFIQSYCN